MRVGRKIGEFLINNNEFFAQKDYFPANRNSLKFVDERENK